MMSKLVPERRFKGFSREWEEKKLGDISTNVMYGMNSSAIKYDGEHKYIRITDIDELSRTFLPNPLTSPDGEIEDKYKLKNDDILFARTGASVGKSYIYKEKDGNLYFAGFLIKFNISGANSKFIFLYTLRNYYDKWVSIMSVRSGQPGINAEEYKLLKLILPIEEKEQQKIADCLSSLDSLIEVQNKKVEALKAHKKGLMQQLFPSEGETVPKLRFDGFSGEWEEKSLGTTLEGESSQIAKNKLKLIDKGYPVYGADGLIGCIDTFSQNKNYIAVVKDGSGVGNLFLYSDKSSLLGTLTYLTSKDEKKYILTFLYYLMQNIDFKPFIKGSGIPHIYYKDYSHKNVHIPKDPKEQQKIANCLSSLDNLIEEQNEKVEALKEHKKGLMQQLFVSSGVEV